MTNPSTLLHHIEQATEGSRELDCLIATHPATPVTAVAKYASVEVLLSQCAFGISGVDAGAGDDVFKYLPKTNADYLGVPHYTTSLDAALTLIPDGWVIETLGDDAAGTPGSMKMIGATCELTNGKETVQAQAATRELAAVAASLKARATVSGETK